MSAIIAACYLQTPIVNKSENQAKQSNIELWNDPHTKATWKIRKLHKKGNSTKDSFSCDIK
jgi:hypothetical protein